ncbi:MAG: hypothetical protein LUD51_05205 [Clostridia bacterium]|nr:hypothetical protein [Clostridia bacterium]
MKVLSVAYTMKPSFTQQDFFRIVESWLASSDVTGEIAKELASSPEKGSMHAESEYSILDTACHSGEDVSYTAVKFEHSFHSSIWTAEIILEARESLTRVFFHIICSGQGTKDNRLEPEHCDVIRAFISSGCIKDPVLPFKPVHMDCKDVQMEWLASAMQPGYKDDVPVVIVSQCFDSYGYDVNVDKLAKKFCGIAYFVTVDNDFTRTLKSRYNLKPPYNGSVAIYLRGKWYAQYQKGRDEYIGRPLDIAVEDDILRAVTSGWEKTAPTWEYVCSERTKAESAKLNAFVNEIFDSNMNKDEKLRLAKEKIEELWKDNESLKTRCESLEAAFRAKVSDSMLIAAGDEKELYDGEQNDLIVSVLQKHLSTTCKEGTRPEELIKSILAKNSLVGAGKEIFDEVSALLSKAGTLNSKDITELERLGFTVVSESMHYKVIFKDNPKYCFSLSKSPSDVRTGKNAAAEIIARLSVYR